MGMEKVRLHTGMQQFAGGLVFIPTVWQYLVHMLNM